MRKQRKTNQNIIVKSKIFEWISYKSKKLGKWIGKWIENALFNFHDITSSFGNSISRPIISLIIATLLIVFINKISLKFVAQVFDIVDKMPIVSSVNRFFYDFFMVILMLFPGGMSIINVMGKQIPWLWILYFVLGYYFTYQFLMAVRNLPRR